MRTVYGLGWGLTLATAMAGMGVAASAGEMPGESMAEPMPESMDGMTVEDPFGGMAQAYPMQDMAMRMAMVHANLFGARVWTGGPRGRDAWAVPGMVMTDLGTSLGARHYLNLNVMLTPEKWLFPDAGYPLLLQIGEQDAQGHPFVDAQHPHSSPIMGLTLSDTIALDVSAPQSYLKLSFAPRGEATDGPIAFMHRATGEVNPDAPLGHHIGQDVGHITSTVLAASLKLGETWLEASAYHGAEPQPEQVDLPLGTPDSFSLRVARRLSPEWLAMVSGARVQGPEPDDPAVVFETRYSASAYWRRALTAGWDLNLTGIYGLITQYDRASALSSLALEFLVRGPSPRIWGRLETLQRLPAELQLPAGEDSARWVSAITVGYTHRLWGTPDPAGIELSLGGSVTRDLLPDDFRAAYGGDPWSGKVFLRLAAMEMAEF